jgi:hypothetical protein
MIKIQFYYFIIYLKINFYLYDRYFKRRKFIILDENLRFKNK